MSLEDDVRTLVERQAIVDLLHHMCHLIDSFQLDRLVEEVFAPDGSDDHGEGPVVGRDAIRAWYEDSTRNVSAVAHNLCNVMVDLHGDKATVRSNVTTWTWTMANAGRGSQRNADYSLSLSYIDELTKYDEGWRIDSRVLVSNTSKTGEACIVAVGELPQTQKGIQALSRKPAPAGDGQTRAAPSP